MTKHIALLRGINVGGHKKILMADLRQIFKSLGYDNACTYIQTGNVIFDSNGNEDNLSLAKKIEDAIQACYDFDVPVMVCTAEELKTIINLNPYWKEKKENAYINKLHLTLFDTPPTEENINILKAIDYTPDSFKIIDRSIYLHCNKQYRDSKLNTNYLEKTLTIKATTRNWKTMLKILELVNK